MNGRYVLTTTLKTRDAVEATADYTLKHNLGLENVLQRVTRKDFWEIALTRAVSQNNANPVNDAEREFLVKLAEETRVFVNPNKHTFDIAPLETIRAREMADGVYSIPVRVSSIDDRKGAGALKTLASMYGTGDMIQTIGNGVLWILEIKAESMDKAQEIARSIVVTRHRRSGLLANPHYENIQLYK